MVLLGPWTARQCCVAIGYVYPMYRSSRALRQGHRQSQTNSHSKAQSQSHSVNVAQTADLLQWVTFWTVNAVFWLLELVGDTIVGGVPFYYESKILFLLWLVLPSHLGARVLYQRWLAPTFEQHEQVIDLALLEMRRRASESLADMCRDTALRALRHGSGVMAHSQQYVAAQLVQHALGTLASPPASPCSSQQSKSPSQPVGVGGGIMPALLSSLLATTTPETSQGNGKSISPVAQVENHKESKSKRATASHPEPTATPTPPLKAKAKASPGDGASSGKSAELVAHFKRLLVKGFPLVYHAGGDAAPKRRMLRLSRAQSRFLLFENASSSSSGKAVALLLHNVRRVAATGGGGDSSELIAAAMDQDRALVVENGKATLHFEAESRKTRDLLVAGLRLLASEHKRQDTVALTALTEIWNQRLKQQAFDRLVAALVGQYQRKLN